MHTMAWYCASKAEYVVQAEQNTVAYVNGEPSSVAHNLSSA